MKYKFLVILFLLIGSGIAQNDLSWMTGHTVVYANVAYQESSYRDTYWFIGTILDEKFPFVLVKLSNDATWGNNVPTYENNTRWININYIYSIVL